MKVVYCKAGCDPAIKEIDGSLESMQSLVGGYLECAPIGDYTVIGNELIVCNEEGKIAELPPNLFIKNEGEIVDIIFGDFFVIGEGSDGEFVGLNDKQIDEYMMLFRKYV